jgi:hypothetical protein
VLDNIDRFKELDRDFEGLDHYFLVGGTGLRLMARLIADGLEMQVWSNVAGVQVSFRGVSHDRYIPGTFLIHNR